MTSRWGRVIVIWFSLAVGLGAQSRMPFVGCASDGQSGPKPAPAGTAQLVAVDAKEARRLAYYKTELGPGVLAPRGWHCYGTYGSGGASTLVTPEPIPLRKLFGESDLRFTGPTVTASFVYSGTSGRFFVAPVLYQCFPELRASVSETLAELGTPAPPLSPGDTVRSLGPGVVTFQTAPRAEGLGTSQRLGANGDAIQGVVVVLGKDYNLVFVCVRLGSGLGGREGAILREVAGRNWEGAL